MSTLLTKDPRVTFTRTGSIRTIVRADMIGNEVLSSANRPVVNTDVVRGNAAGKAVASVSKGFSLDISSSGTVLIISCLNCGSIRLSTSSGGLGRVILGRSARVLSRIIMINCNTIGGSSLANTMTSISAGRLATTNVSDTTNTVRNMIPNIGVRHSSGGPNDKCGVLVHNLGAIDNDAGPLVMVSNIPNTRLRGVGPSSVRGVSVLGSTSSATVCNSETAGKIMVIAAGEKGTKTPGIDCSNSIKFGGCVGTPSVVSKRRCIRLTQRCSQTAGNGKRCISSSGVFSTSRLITVRGGGCVS